MRGIRDRRIPEPSPPEGIVEMVCTLFENDPEHMQAYAALAARVDHYLLVRGLSHWSSLDAGHFVRHCAVSRAEAPKLCCMLAAVLPWMVRARDLTSSQARRMCLSLSQECDADLNAWVCIEVALDQIARVPQRPPPRSN